MKMQPAEEFVIARKPWGLAVNPVTQMIYVTDREQHQVLVYTHIGDPAFAFGQFGRCTGEFRRPCGIAFDSCLDRVYVTDKDNHRVQVFNAIGRFLFAFGTRGKKNGQFAFPWGIAVNHVGTLVVIADSRNHRLQIFNEHGTFMRKIADRGVFFDYPRGVAFDPTGQYVFSTDFNLHHVLCTDVEFKHRCRVVVQPEQLNRPQAIHVSPTGHLFVASASDSTIKVFDAWTGNSLYEISSLGGVPLDLPLNAISIHQGNLAVLEMNGKISII
jgi:DNA-binding beta-propeller fold protein YncE